MFNYYRMLSRTSFHIRNFSSQLQKKISPIKMSYKIFNADQNITPILIMHGLLGSKMNWNGIARQLQEINRKVVIMDARNHGDSPHSNEMTYEHLAEDIHLLMNDLNFPKATCIGHSMGGRAMMMFAIKYPELVKQLIVVDISPFSSKTLNETPKYIEALLKVRFSSGIPIGQMRKLAFEQLEESIPDKDTRQFLLTNLIEKEGTFKWKSNIELLFQNKNEILQFDIPEDKSFEGPTLFLAGANSDFINPSLHQRIQRIFPKAEFFYVEGAGHNIHYDKPSEFIKHTLNFIEK